MRERDPKATTIVISDLHFGAADAFDIFAGPGKTESFENFLRHHGESPEPIELVIDGDFVDFLQLEPWGEYGLKDVALTKIGKIVMGQKAVFAAMGEFLKNPKNQIRVLLGNHDIELAFDPVWATVRNAITKGDRELEDRICLLHRATQYNPWINGVLVHIEHGNQGDAFNDISYTELFEYADSVRDHVPYPPGTKLVYRVMNDFKRDLQFVDLLKPESVVIWMLMLLKPLKAGIRVPQTAFTAMQSLGNAILGRMRRLAGGGAFGAAPADAPEDEALLRHLAERYVQTATGGDLARFQDFDADRFQDFLTQESDADPGEGDSFGGRPGVVRSNLIKLILETIDGRPAFGDRAFYQQDHAGADISRAEERMRGSVGIVVFGHTHGALKTDIPDKGLYLNSGAWANLMSVPQGPAEFESWLTGIVENKFERTSFPTYIRLSPDKSGVAAELCHWTGTTGEVLWQGHRSPRS